MLFHQSESQLYDQRSLSVCITSAAHMNMEESETTADVWRKLRGEQTDDKAISAALTQVNIIYSGNT